MKHAKAPWTAQKQASNDEMHIISADNRFIASLEGEVYDEREPYNAALIIAAPDLLAACELALIEYRGVKDEIDAVKLGCTGNNDATTNMLTYAIAKSKGEIA